MQVIGQGSQTALEGPPGERLLNSPGDVVDIIGSCFEHEARAVLFYAENLTEHFFDLSSGEAGTILQKLRNYHIRLAVVMPQNGLHQSERFRELAAEENKGDDFRLFDDRASAEAWLLNR